jgi:hypothetical protein
MSMTALALTMILGGGWRGQMPVYADKRGWIAGWERKVNSETTKVET